MAGRFELTCGQCQESRTLTGDAPVMAAELATFVAAHADHTPMGLRPEPGAVEGAGPDTVPAG